ncbi:MAG: hypothetical protein JO307_01475 [Bryobacterales bacterium]|nr:hypothetical protein [Bryobacterales bacterium]MBV9399997.1 hypothetical protein [Bryobacterales bacterium]
MQFGEAVEVRLLPAGPRRAATMRASQGRFLEIEVSEAPAELDIGTPAELESQEAVYLGLIERRENSRLWIKVEHMLDQSSLAVLRSQWRENGSEGA